MLLYKPTDKIYANTLEIHYWLQNGLHQMDASVENRCEYELIGIIKEVCKLLDTEMVLETEALGEGGLRRWLRLIGKQENSNATITTAVIVALVTLILITPLSEITEQVIEKWFEDTELKDLEKEKLRLEIRKLRREENKELNELDTNVLIKKKRSNFYESLEKEPRVEKISFKSWDPNKKNDTEEKFVPRSKFLLFVMTSDDYESIEDENAVIEIISPVLKKGRYKWSGYYNGDVIIFSMSSNEFKELVQVGKVEFKNGSTIDCHLSIKRKINSEGILFNSGYDVIRVNKYFESDEPIETREGKKHRVNKEAAKLAKQLSLFDQDNQ